MACNALDVLLMVYGGAWIVSQPRYFAASAAGQFTKQGNRSIGWSIGLELTLSHPGYEV
jgi:hypothetical protein